MSEVAVLVIDMLNTYEHEDADVLVGNVADVIDPLAGLISRARGHDDVDLVYVNDNYGDFDADFRDIVDAALHGARPDLVEPIAPDENSLRLLKVRHSAFYASSLDYLLRRLDARQLILTGQVTEQCILYSALDAYVRHFDIVVAPDAVAHIAPELRDAALTMMHKNMHAEIVPAEKCLD
ncbi:MAG TPA: isochorismatase family cysteine hydrolase [Mycobacterium sp.]|nr:isochorismatase family cysteine hydrolase [Mycobacterium sp.]